MRLPMIIVIFSSLWVNSGQAQSAVTPDPCAQFLTDTFFADSPLDVLLTCVGTAKVDERDANGRTALHIAVSVRDDTEVLRALLLRGWDLTLRDAENQTPLHRAAGLASNGAIISDLIAFGADVNEPIDPTRNFWRQLQGTTPLYLASGRPDAWDVVAALIAAGANVNAFTADGRRPLHNAARIAQDPLAVLLLVRAGAVVHATDLAGNQALHLAGERNATAVVTRMLLASGASPDALNEAGQTPLQMTAAYSTSEEVFSLMFGAATAACARDPEGRSAATNAELNPALMGTDTYWRLHQQCAAVE